MTKSKKKSGKSRKAGAGLTLEEALDLAREAPPLTPAKLAYLRSAQAGIDADREYGAPPRRGRPRKGEPHEEIVGKTVKHTPEFWRKLAKTAAKRGMSVHEAMRAALVEWVKQAS